MKEEPNQDLIKTAEFPDPDLEAMSLTELVQFLRSQNLELQDQNFRMTVQIHALQRLVKRVGLCAVIWTLLQIGLVVLLLNLR